MNVSRLVASIAGYALSTSGDGAAFHLYGGFQTTATIAGVKVRLGETSAYPWEGAIRIEVSPEQPAAFDLKLRIPGWATGWQAAVNGEKIALKPVNGYATIHRQWRPGDIVTLGLEMPAERLYAHPLVRMDVGRVALRRGPLIYCVEEADNPGAPVQTLTLPRSAEVDAEWRDDLFGGVMTLNASAKRLVPGKDPAALYSTAPPAEENAALVALPYFLWANRAPGSMQVWVAEAGG
jgi:DUF1680 family protein